MEAVRKETIRSDAARAEGLVSCVHHRRISACVDVEIRQVGEVLKHRFVDQPGASFPQVILSRENPHICDTPAADAKLYHLVVYIEAASHPALPISTCVSPGVS